MKKLNKDNILEKPQYCYILLELVKSIPGLTLHELTYLLSIQPIKYRNSMIAEKFEKRTRKNIFKTRQRIQDCLTNLIKLHLVDKKEKSYRVNFYELYLLIQEEKIKNELIIAEQELRKQFEEIKQEFNNLNDVEKSETMKDISQSFQEYILNKTNQVI